MELDLQTFNAQRLDKQFSSSILFLLKPGTS